MERAHEIATASLDAIATRAKTIQEARILAKGGLLRLDKPDGATPFDDLRHRISCLEDRLATARETVLLLSYILEKQDDRRLSKSDAADVSVALKKAREYLRRDQ